MSQTVKAKSTRKNVGTQTREIDTMLEIARLQEQVKLLSIENDHLRKYTMENSPRVLKSITSVTRPNDISETLEHNETVQKNLQNQSIQKKNIKLISRGCNCKGKCSSKICGCVKKSMQCGEYCKCNNDACQNQADKDVNQNKENLEHNESRYKHVESKKIINKHMMHVHPHKSLFSPDTTIQESVPNVEQFKSTPLYFGNPKTLTFDSDEEDEKEEPKRSENRKLKKPSLKNNKRDQKAVVQQKGRTKKNSLEVNSSDYTRKLRSTSNEEKRVQNTIRIEKHALRKCSSNEIQVNDEFKQTKKGTDKYIQNIMSGMVSLRRGQKGSNNKIKETTATNTANSAKRIGPISVEDNMKKVLDNVTNETVRSFQVEEMNSDKIATDCKNKSYDIDENSENFDPMKPKHELPRTPVHQSNEIMSSNISNSSITMSTISIKKDIPQIPAELSQMEVNWEEYQAQLVICGKCKRKFHPLRIEKHRSCCKKL